MYEAFFHLRRRPFAAAVQVERYFPAASIEQARKTIVRCVERAEGPAIVVGPAGAGKTLLCQHLAKQLSDRFKTAVLTCGHVGARRALLQAILFELGQPFRGLDEGELRLALVDYALTGCRDAQGVVLLVDEAHTLSPRLLEELRLITNLSSGGEQRVRLVLAGAASLEEVFANPKLESFSQRLAARTYLVSLDRAETAAYVKSQVAGCGGDANSLFSAEALEMLHRSTDGVPRLINQVCDHALILAHVAGEKVVSGKTIEEAWGDLQQLPTRWSEPPAAGGAGQSVVEFGQLDAEPETPHAIPFQRRGGGWSELAVDEQLDQSEQLLNQLEEEFTPAGSIGPKSEIGSEIIVTPEPHPFGEEFFEEEIVIDRYTSLDLEMFAGCPTVTSVEGHALGQSLAAAARALDSSRASAPRAETFAAPRADAPKPRVETYTSSFEIGAGENVRPFTTEPRRAPADDAVAARAAESRSTDGRSAGNASAEKFDYHVSAEDLEDSDLIVVEDDPAPPPTLIRARPQVRRQEYRQLFAKLRRG